MADVNRGNRPLSPHLEVYRFSDGDYLEDQDYWKISGIEREVILHAMPGLQIRYFFVHADPDRVFPFEITPDVVCGFHTRCRILSRPSSSVRAMIRAITSTASME